MAAATSLEHNLRRYAPTLLLILALSTCPALAELNVVIIEGLGGEQRYVEQFDKQITALKHASLSVTSNDRVRVFRTSDADRNSVLEYFEFLSSQSSADDTLSIYLVGHGSYDDHEYKFNLPGPDLTGEDIATTLGNQPEQNILLVNTSSSSGAIAELLQGERRTLVFATRSGSERHATRFGLFFYRSAGKRQC